MNRNWLILTGITFLTIFAAPIFAADSSDNAAPTTQSDASGKRGEALQRFKSALEQLNLTDDQKEKIKTIMSDAKAKLLALKGDADAKTQARDILMKTRQDIMAVLDATQKAKLREDSEE